MFAAKAVVVLANGSQKSGAPLCVLGMVRTLHGGSGWIRLSSV